MTLNLINIYLFLEITFRHESWIKMKAYIQKTREELYSEPSLHIDTDEEG